MKDLMIDIETMGVNHNAAIIQLGAVFFDRNTGETGAEFSENISLESSLKEGLEVNASTIEWWMQQSEEARKAVFDKPKDIRTVLDLFNRFASPAKCIWSHATFDFVILTNALKKVDIRPTFSYKSARDIRTLVDLANVSYSNAARHGTHHNAIDDCLFQVEYCIECFKKLR